MSWKKKNIEKNHNNRLYFLIAIVFLLFLGCIYKLYKIQIIQGGYFSELASDQHRVHSELQPERGEILIEKEKKTGENDFYALATNRDFALVYAIPKDIEKEEEVAEKLYTFFDKEEVIKKVKEELRKNDQKKINQELKKALHNTPEEKKNARINTIKEKWKNLRNSQKWQEERQKEIEKRVKKEKEKIIDNYIKTLSKRNDPYEPLKKKVLPEKLKEMYIFLGNKSDLSPEDLKIRNGQVYFTSEKKTEKKFQLKGISHLMQSYRYYPEEGSGSHLLGFVSYAQGEPEGSYGLEGFFDKELSGDVGYIRSAPVSTKDSVVINDRKYKRAKDGSDLILTIDRAVQFHVCQKLNKTARKHGADKGSVVVVKPQTGEIMAMCSWPTFDPNNYSQVNNIKVFNNPAVFDEYEPGSVFKTITLAIALNENKITPRTTYVDEGKLSLSGYEIKNSDFASKGGHGEVDMNYVLEHSLNTGAIFAMEKTGPEVFSEYVSKFGFGTETGIELEGEADGSISQLKKEKTPKIYAATASFGQGITATPLQVAMAYAAIANDGVLMKPYLVKKIIHNDDTSENTKPVQVRKVISEETSALISGMLVNVVEGGHAKLASVSGYYVGGKTGTAEVASSYGGYGGKTIHTFVGFAPIDNPKFVMLVKLNDPKDVRYSASSAAPLFGELAKFMLNYYQVPKSR